MIVTIIQPPYPRKGEARQVLQWQIDALNNIQPGETDLILFPENANCTGNIDAADLLDLINGKGAEFVEVMRQTARRTGAVIMSGLTNINENGEVRNQLTVFPPDAQEFSPYTKVHLVEPELKRGLIPGPGATSFEYKGVRYGAAICFDHYFPELFVEYAKQRIDIMLLASHQRQERPEILEFTTRSRAFDCGCTVLRSAPAMYTPDVGGKSMVVAPDGTVLADGGGIPGIIQCEIDPHARFRRAASYNEPERILDYREALLLSRDHVDNDK